MSTRKSAREGDLDSNGAATKLAEAGWGVIFAQDADPALREALAPLLELRRRQAGDRFRIFSGSAGLRPRESASQFLERHRGELPHYLLLVGGEEAIPSSFETQLARRFAVERVAFEHLEEYASYAWRVLQAETDDVILQKRCESYEPPWAEVQPADDSTRSPSLGETVNGGLVLERGDGGDYDLGDELLGGRKEGSIDRGWHDEGRRGEPAAGSFPEWEDERPASPPLVAAAAKEEVAFAAYPPRRLTPGVPRRMLVYLHLEAALQEVEADAAGRHGAAAADFRRSEAKHRARLAKGTEILLAPAGEGLSFEPPEARLTWAPPWQRAEFEVLADGSRAGHVANASIACFVGPLQVAEIPLKINLLEGEEEAADEPPAEPAVAKLYQSIFASYSHADTALVKAMEVAQEALGNNYLRDVMTLKPGQDWSEELLAMIDRADIFQLFWSQKASESPYVEQEWRRALKQHRQKGGAFIRPLSWEIPMPKVPRELVRIHFKAVELSPLGALIPVPGPSVPAKGRNVKTFAGGELAAWTFVTAEGDLENRFIDPGAEAKDLAVHEASVRAALSALS
jgi:hypothetical protein